MGEDFGGFKLPKLVELCFGLQGVSVNAVEIFEVSQELFGGSTFLPVEGRHLFGKEGEQVVDDIRAFGFGGKLLRHEGQHTVRISFRQTELAKLFEFLGEGYPFLLRRPELNAANRELTKILFRAGDPASAKEIAYLSKLPKEQLRVNEREHIV